MITIKQTKYITLTLTTALLLSTTLATKADAQRNRGVWDQQEVDQASESPTTTSEPSGASNQVAEQGQAGVVSEQQKFNRAQNELTQAREDYENALKARNSASGPGPNGVVARQAELDRAKESLKEAEGAYKRAETDYKATSQDDPVAASRKRAESTQEGSSSTKQDLVAAQNNYTKKVAELREAMSNGTNDAQVEKLAMEMQSAKTQLRAAQAKELYKEADTALQTAIQNDAPAEEIKALTEAKDKAYSKYADEFLKASKTTPAFKESAQKQLDEKIQKAEAAERALNEAIKNNKTTEEIARLQNQARAANNELQAARREAGGSQYKYSGSTLKAGGQNAPKMIPFGGISDGGSGAPPSAIGTGPR